MKKTALLILALLLFTFNSFAQDDTRVSAAWRVLKYDITATLPQTPTDRYLNAKAMMNLQNVGNGAGSRLTLRINEKAEVAAVQVNGATATFSKGQESIGTNRNLQRIIVNVPSIQPNANFSVSVDYKLKVEENSGLNALSPTGSQFLPMSFWYPTPNSQYATRGADFAPFSLKVTAANENVISSGAQSGTNYEQKLNGQPFFLTGSWDVIEAKGVSVYLPKGAGDFEKQRASELANLAAEASTFAASLLGSAPSVPLRIVAVRRGSGFGDSGTLLLDYGAFRRQKIDSLTAETVAESIAKIWLGNIKTVRGEGYGVIREGLSRFIATQFLEKQYGPEAANMERSRQRTAYAAVSRSESPYNIASPLDNAYYSSVANRGAMIWRALGKQVGMTALFDYIKAQDSYTLQNIRTNFAGTSNLLEDAMTNVNETNLLVGLPQAAGGETKIALRNTGSMAATVNVLALTDKGERLVTAVTIQPKSYGEASFKTASKIIRTEIDPEKIIPQIDFSDDVAPREFTDSNPLVVVKRAFDQQDYAGAEKNARIILLTEPNSDDARTWLGRALLAQNKLPDAEKEFQLALAEKIPTPNTLAWANVGLGEIALKSNQMPKAAGFYDEVIKSNIDYGATLAARVGRQKTNLPEPTDESVKAYFAQFDKAAVSGRKAEFDNLIMPGEVSKFASGISGQTEQWKTTVIRVDKLDSNNAIAEVSLNIKVLDREPQSGMAVLYLTNAGGWKLSGVEIFEVR